CEEPLHHAEGFDGMMTAQEGTGLLIRHADCQAAIFYDPKRRVIANIHCGWRGSVQNIYQKTVTQMEERYGTRARDLFVCIGPSLGPYHAEFIHYKEEIPPSFWAFQVRPNHFDFWA